MFRGTLLNTCTRNMADIALQPSSDCFHPEGKHLISTLIKHRFPNCKFVYIEALEG